MIKIGSGRYLEFKKKAEELDKREIGAKPTDVYQMTFGDDNYTAMCGNCRGHIFNNHNYCPKCGYKIHWGW